MSELPREHRPLYEELKKLVPSASIEPDKLNGATIFKWKFLGKTHTLTPKADGMVEVGGEEKTVREFVEGVG